MTKTTRYGLIIAGLCIFFVVAPILVLYVQGKALNLKNRDTELTGIISIKTSPASTNVQVEHEPAIKSPNAIRFLKTGDYNVTVSKTGYKTWHKTLNVIAGKVTYANPNPYPLHLLKEATPVKLASDVNAYVNINDKILYATNNTLVLLKPTDGHSITTKTPSTITRLAPDKQSNNILVTGPKFTGVLNADNMQLVDFSGSTNDSLDMSLENGWLWSVTRSGTLTGTHLDKPSKTFTFTNNVHSFLIQNEDIYYLSKDTDTTNTLHHRTISGTELVQDQILASNIPITGKSTILLDSSKAVYLLLDTTLWRINGSLEFIENNVQKADTDSGILAYAKPGELWWYESTTNKTHLVTRATEDFSSFYVNPSLSYAFFAENNKVMALELDERSGQNRYELATSQDSIESISVLNLTDIFFRLGKDLYSLAVFDN